MQPVYYWYPFDNVSVTIIMDIDITMSSYDIPVQDQFPLTLGEFLLILMMFLTLFSTYFQLESILLSLQPTHRLVALDFMSDPVPSVSPPTQHQISLDPAWAYGFQRSREHIEYYNSPQADMEILIICRKLLWFNPCTWELGNKCIYLRNVRITA